MPETVKITPEQALTNLRAVAKAYKGTLDEHVALQESANVLTAFIEDHSDTDGEKSNPELSGEDKK